MFARLHKYGTCNTHDALKAIAILLMVIDHVGYYLFPENIALRIIGRMAFPLFFFLIGYNGSTRISRSLILFACVLVLLNGLLNYPIFALNILFAVIAVRLFFRAYEKYHWQTLPRAQLFTVLLIWLLPTSFLFEYGTAAILIALSAYFLNRDSGTKSTHYFFYAALFTYFIVECWNLKLNPEYILWMGANLSVIALLLWRYKLVSLPESLSTSMGKGVCMLGRYSLEFYFWHLVLLKIVSYVLFPENHQHFQWWILH